MEREVGSHPPVSPAAPAAEVAGLAAVLERIPDGVVLVGGDGTVVLANGWAERMFGYEPGELPGHPVEDLLPEHLRGVHRHHRGRYARDPVTRPMGLALELHAMRRDGTPFPVDVSLGPVEGGDGETLVMATVRDMTDRRQLEDRYRAISDLVTDVAFVFRLDPRTRAIEPEWMSESFARLTGYGVDEWVAAGGWAGLVHPDDQAWAWEALGRLVEGEPVELDELRLVTRGGEVRWLRTWAQPRLDPGGTVVGFVGAAEDITERKLATLALAESERRLREAQVVGRMGYWRRDLATGSLVWSSELYRIFGVDRDTFPATFDALLELVHPFDRESFLASARAATAGTDASEYEFRIVRPDGAVRWIVTRARPETDEAGRSVALTGISQDVTERREAEERYRLVSEVVTDVAVSFSVGDDAVPVVEWVTDGHERLTGYRVAETHEFGFTELVHPDDREWYGERLAALGEGESDESDVRITRRDGEVRWVRITFRRVASVDGRLRYVGAVRDVHERRLAEQMLREAYRQQREALEGLRAADRLKDDFISTASHELRTPIAAIAGLAAALSRHSGSLELEARREIAEKLERNALELGAMVERLLDFSRLQAGTVGVEPRRLRVGDLLRQCLDVHATELATHRLHIDADADLHVLADVHGVGHVLGNLVSNAVNYSPPGSLITIAAHRADGEVVVIVADEGPGIESSDQARIFERFVRGSGATPGRRGTGIGLAIARSYVELMGGRIWLDSQPGRGSTFSFTLPTADDVSLVGG